MTTELTRAGYRNVGISLLAIVEHSNMPEQKPIPFRKRKPRVGTLVRPRAALIPANVIRINGETVVTPGAGQWPSKQSAA